MCPVGKKQSSNEMKMKISDIKEFPVSFWLLSVCTMTYYGAMFTFIALAKEYFKERYSVDGETSNFIVGK